jgi:hypothetical protein
MMNLKSKNLDKAFSGVKISSESPNEIVDDGKPETYKIANFTEELKDRANYNGMDICFVLDVTASMSSYIEGEKESIRTIIADAKQSLVEMEQDEDTLKFSMVIYRDHPPEDTTFVTQVLDFSDSKTALDFLDNARAQGGGDGSEAVLDGLNDAINTVKWREDSEKFLFLALDWPPHGKRFESTSDNFPNGCPCGYHEKDLLPKIRDMKIDFTIIKIADYINTMIELFSQYCNIDVFQPKIFKQKQAFGGSTSSAYTESVKVAMSKNISSNINTKLMVYSENYKNKK